MMLDPCRLLPCGVCSKHGPVTLVFLLLCTYLEGSASFLRAFWGQVPWLSSESICRGRFLWFCI